MDTKLSVYMFGTLIFLIICLCSATQIDSSCDDKTKCQYQCHCEQPCIGNDSTCPQMSKCSVGWFGLKCQYRNLFTAGEVSVTTLPAKHISNLTDNDVDTCVTDVDLITITWHKTHRLTWLRLVKSSLSQILNLTLHYKEANVSSSKDFVPCKQVQLYLANNRTLDVRCLHDIITSSIQIQGKILSLCSLYISGGRNFAYMQRSELSTTHVDLGITYGGDKAVDGYKPMCAVSALEDKSPTLTVLLQEPIIIQRVLLHTAGISQQGLRHFRLNISNRANDTSFSYTDNSAYAKTLHEVNVDSGEQLQRVDVGADVRMILCEIEVFGECPPGKWGLRCINDCPAHCKSNCHIDDGSCNTICIGPQSNITVSTTSTTEATTSAGLKCPNIQEHGSIFSATVAGREATSPCPANYSGNVNKQCNNMGSWEPGDFSRCNRTSFASLLNSLTNVTTPDGVNQLSKEIGNVFKLGPSTILSGDIVKMSEVLAQLGQRTEKYKIVVTKDAVENVANVVETLFSSDDGVWKGVSKGNNSSDAGVSGLISSMEYFTQSILNSSKFTNHDVSLGTHVDLLFWQETTNIGNYTRSGNNIVFPKNKNGSFQCYVLTYKNITGKFAINGLIDDSQNAAQSTDLTLNSDIISLSAQPKPIVSLDNPLNLTFKTQINTGKLQVCVYLTKNLTWSTEGCRIHFFPKSVQCSCSHFSTFAVLMSPSQLQPATVYTTATTIKPVMNCPLVVKDGVVFNETKPGEHFTTPCPPRYTGFISRRCNTQGDWESVDTNNCLQEVLQSVLTESIDIKEIGALEKITNITERVSSVMKNNSKENILSGDIRTVVGIFAEVGSASKQFNLTLSKKNLGSIINTVDKLLASEGDVWKGVTKGENRTDAGAKLLFSLENITQGILNSNTSNFTEISLNEANIVVELKKRTTKVIAFKEIENEITLSQPKEETFKYSIIIYKNISEKFTVGHFQDKEHKPAIEKQPKIFNSDVISFSVEPKPDSVTLKKNPLILTFKLLNSTNHKQFCVYLKDSSSSNDSTWSTDGCTTKIEQDKVICTCTHLTNFAVLMSPYKISETHSSIISLISSIGITISLICLAVTIAVYGIMWRFVKSDRAVLHVNLSVSLFMGYTVFLVGIGKTDNSTTCGIVAGLLHFLFLVVFFVMLAEGLLIHKSVTSVSSVSILKYLVPLMYGGPLAIVIISVAATQGQGYGYKEWCWLDYDSGLLWAFVVPAFTVLMTNIIILINVIRIMQSAHCMMDKDMKKKTQSVIRSIFILSPILGITWALGIFSITVDHVLFQYLFAMCNSLQGLFIFIFQCVLQYQVRDGLRSLLRRYRSTSFESSSKVTSSCQDKGGYSESLIQKQMASNEYTSLDTTKGTTETMAENEM